MRHTGPMMSVWRQHIQCYHGTALWRMCDVSTYSVVMVLHCDVCIQSVHIRDVVMALARDAYMASVHTVLSCDYTATSVWRQYIQCCHVTTLRRLCDVSTYSAIMLLYCDVCVTSVHTVLSCYYTATSVWRQYIQCSHVTTLRRLCGVSTYRVVMVLLCDVCVVLWIHHYTSRVINNVFICLRKMSNKIHHLWDITCISSENTTNVRLFLNIVP